MTDPQQTEREKSKNYQNDRSYFPSDPIRQRQRRLTEAQAIEMAERYKGEATAHKLAAECVKRRLANVEIITLRYGIFDEGQYFVEDLKDSRLTYVNFGILTIIPTEIDERFPFRV